MSTGGAATVAAAPLPSKAWFLSKGLWTGVVTFLVGLYVLVYTTWPGLHLPSIDTGPLASLLAILGALGFYSRATAKTILTPPGGGS